MVYLMTIDRDLSTAMVNLIECAIVGIHTYRIVQRHDGGDSDLRRNDSCELYRRPAYLT